MSLSPFSSSTTKTDKVEKTIPYSTFILLTKLFLEPDQVKQEQLCESFSKAISHQDKAPSLAEIDLLFTKAREYAIHITVEVLAGTQDEISQPESVLDRTCPLCNTLFSSACTLSRHKVTVHLENGSTVICPFCPPSHLNAHTAQAGEDISWRTSKPRHYPKKFARHDLLQKYVS